MIDSMRRVIMASLAIVGLVFILSAASSDFSLCTKGVSCVASVTLYGANAGPVGQSTPQFINSSSLVTFNEIVRVVSFGGLLALGIVFAVLELLDPRFFKVLLKHRPAR